MNKLTLPIVIGRQYQRRDGKVVTTIASSESNVARVIQDGKPLPGGSVYLESGLFSHGREHAFDLVSDFDPPALTLPIVIGKRYRRRDGAIRWARAPHEAFGDPLAYIGSATVATNLDDDHVWLSSGRVNVGQHQHDLVADYIEPEPVDAEVPRGHPHAALMALYAQDAAETPDPWMRWEMRPADWQGTPEWRGVSRHPSWDEHTAFRRKPKTIRIGEFDVPEPLRRAPQSSERYFYPSITFGNGPACLSNHWGCDPVGERLYLARGLLHLTKEAAELHARALLSFTSTTGAPAA